MNGFELCSVSLDYNHHRVLNNVSITLTPGQHTAILGPSGCGKTSLLRVLSGLDAPSEGRVMLNGNIASQTKEVIMPPHQRGIAMVFQDLALWPGLSVFDNVLLGLSVNKSMGRNTAQERAREALVICGIENLAKRLPSTLSGGQQQRVALARAIAVRPTFLFLDEPFSGLDLTTKFGLLADIKVLAEQHAFTMVLVTHDPLEVSSLCEVAVVLEAGAVCELGELKALLAQPQSETLRVFRSQLMG